MDQYLPRFTLRNAIAVYNPSNTQLVQKYSTQEKYLEGRTIKRTHLSCPFCVYVLDFVKTAISVHSKHFILHNNKIA
jgi:hypothetical protein